jgi:hypothetical protein
VSIDFVVLYLSKQNLIFSVATVSQKLIVVTNDALTISKPVLPRNHAHSLLAAEGKSSPSTKSFTNAQPIADETVLSINRSNLSQSIYVSSVKSVLQSTFKSQSI